MRLILSQPPRTHSERMRQKLIPLGNIYGLQWQGVSLITGLLITGLDWTGILKFLHSKVCNDFLYKLPYCSTCAVASMTHASLAAAVSELGATALLMKEGYGHWTSGLGERSNSCRFG